VDIQYIIIKSGVPSYWILYNIIHIPIGYACYSVLCCFSDNTFIYIR